MTWACSLQVFFSFFTSIANIWNCHYSTLCCFILSKVSDQGWRGLMKANNCNSTLWVVRDISSSISYYFSVHSLVSFYLKWKWHDIRPSTRNSCSAFNHSSAHTQREHTHTHTMNTHRSWQPFMLQRPGAVGGSVSCSRAPQSWYWGWRESASYSLPPPTIPAGPRLELTTFSLRIRLTNH